MSVRARCRIGLVVACLGLQLTGGSASAEPCTTPLTDGAGNVWQQATGLVAVTPPGGGLPVAGFGSTGLNAPPALIPAPLTPVTCTSELGGRQLVEPELAVGPTVTLTRKFFVPSDSPAFARILDTWTNPSAAAITIQPLLATVATPGGIWRQTSSGDALVTTADDSVVLANTAPGVTPTLPVAAERWSGPGARRRVAQFAATIPLVPWTSGTPQHLAVFEEMTLAPGESLTLMSAYLLRPPGDAGATAAQSDIAAIGAEPERLFTGISPDDQKKIVNFRPIESDGDGVRDVTDDCPDVANPDQKDTDGDGQGDVCDADDDGDAVPDAVEAQLGGDPLRQDTDGDGKVDSADACLKLPAATADGCPASFGENPADRIAPVCAIAGVMKTIKRKAFLKGVAVTVTCDEPATIDGELLGSARSVRLAASFNLTLGTKSLGLGGGARKLTIKPSKRLVGKAKKLTVQLRVTATDASGNRTRKLQAFKVK